MTAARCPDCEAVTVRERGGKTGPYVLRHGPLCIAWAAGLFEGEGSITTSRGRFRLQIEMTDEESVRRFHAIVAAGRVYGPYTYTRPDGYIRNPVFQWKANGGEAARAGRLLRPWLGTIRRARLDEILQLRDA